MAILFIRHSRGKAVISHSLGALVSSLLSVLVNRLGNEEVEGMNLMFKGSALDPNQTLESQGVGSKSTLRLQAEASPEGAAVGEKRSREEVSPEKEDSPLDIEKAFKKRTRASSLPPVEEEEEEEEDLFGFMDEGGEDDAEDMEAEAAIRQELVDEATKDLKRQLAAAMEQATGWQELAEKTNAQAQTATNQLEALQKSLMVARADLELQNRQMAQDAAYAEREKELSEREMRAQMEEHARAREAEAKAAAEAEMEAMRAKQRQLAQELDEAQTALRKRDDEGDAGAAAAMVEVNSARDALRELEEQRQAAIQASQVSEKEVQRLMTEVESANAFGEKAAGELTALREQLAAVSAREHQVGRQKEEQDAAIKQLQSQIQEKEGVEAAVQDLRAKLAEVMATHDERVDDIARLEAEKESARQAAEQAESQRADQVAQSQAAILEEQRKVAALQTQLETVQGQLQTVQSQTSAAVAEGKAAVQTQAENIVQRAQEESARALADLQRQLEDARAETATAKAQAAARERELEDARAETATAEAQAAARERELEDAAEAQAAAREREFEQKLAEAAAEKVEAVKAAKFDFESFQIGKDVDQSAADAEAAGAETAAAAAARQKRMSILREKRAFGAGAEQAARRAEAQAKVQADARTRAQAKARQDRRAKLDLQRAQNALIQEDEEIEQEIDEELARREKIYIQSQISAGVEAEEARVLAASKRASDLRQLMAQLPQVQDKDTRMTLLRGFLDGETVESVEEKVGVAIQRQSESVEPRAKKAAMQPAMEVSTIAQPDPAPAPAAVQSKSSVLRSLESRGLAAPAPSLLAELGGK